MNSTLIDYYLSIILEDSVVGEYFRIAKSNNSIVSTIRSHKFTIYID